MTLNWSRTAALLLVVLLLAACSKAQTPADPGVKKAESPAAAQPEKAPAPAAEEPAPAAGPAAAVEAPAPAEPEAAAQPQPGEVPAPVAGEAAPEQEPTDEQPAEEPGAEAEVEAQPAPTQPTESEFIINARRLKDRADKDLKWAREVAGALTQTQAELQALALKEESARLLVRMPVAPDVEGLEKLLTDYTKSTGLPLKDLKVEIQELKRRELPPILNGKKAITYEPSDFRGLILATFWLEERDRAKLAPWFDGLKSQDRLLEVKQMKYGENGYLVNVAAYYLPEVSHPLLKSDPKNFKEVMQATGIKVSVEDAVRQDPVGYIQNATMTYVEYNDLLPTVNQTLALQSDLIWRKARLDYLEEKEEEVAALKFEE